ncbi:hypothetical protein ACGRL8_13335 [Vibrio rumoiensis]|uniref:Uncharacterized protein n=1 Tax=Vibrio rumoiensis TaxID=76258 RepID=A0ABW7IZE1_9VIBR
MKKTIIASAVLGLVAFNTFAVELGATPNDGDIDTTSAEINWVAQIPTVVPGAWVTMTGAEGGAVRDGVLTVQNDGKFDSDEIPLEIRQYDADSGQVGAGVSLDSTGADTGAVVPVSITYQAENVTFTSEKGYDLTGADAKITETVAIAGPVTPGADYELNSTDAWKTSWKVENGMGGELPNVIAGDTITATTVIRADVAFAAVP